MRPALVRPFGSVGSCFMGAHPLLVCILVTSPNEPLPVRVTDWKAAERAAAEHMRTELRFANVWLTAEGADNGIDVRANGAVAQVKWYKSPVGIAEVQRLKGTATRGDWAVFYASLSGYTKSAIEAATNGNVALFKIGLAGLVFADNHVARMLERLRAGLPAATSPNMTLGEQMATSRRIWELNALMRPYEARIDKIVEARREMVRTVKSLLKAVPHDERAARILARFASWIDEDGDASLAAAQDRMRKATTWLHQFPPNQMDIDRGPIIRFLESSAGLMPDILEDALGSVPLPRAQIEAWCDEWTAIRHVRELTPNLKSTSAVQREIAERLAKYGPDRSTLERHAKQSALRVTS
jgi:hypothetical protein